MGTSRRSRETPTRRRTSSAVFLAEWFPRGGIVAEETRGEQSGQVSMLAARLAVSATGPNAGNRRTVITAAMAMAAYSPVG